MNKQLKEEECIALDKKYNKCRVLIGGTCDGKCAFFCTKEQHDKAIEKVFERLRKLPDVEQRAIADKYYGTKRVWRKENKNGKCETV